MATVVRHYLRVEPDQSMDGLLEQFAAAMWMEERQATVTANALAKALGGK